MSRTATAEARLRDAEWRKRGETQTILAILDGAAGRTRAVGGVVRDTILGRSRINPDIDLATELHPDEVMARAGAAGIAVHPTGIEHGTVTLVLGGTLAEVTTLRRDVETDGRHAVVAFGTDWAVDAGRRDFTLNALYAFADGTLFDPLQGLGDCLEGRVRFIGDAAARIAEDGLRVFRFFRFSASHGGERFDADGEAACAAAVGRLTQVPAERIGAEMVRMLKLPRVAETLRAMARIELVEIADRVLQGLKTYERQAGQPKAEARLALLFDGEAAESLQGRWRLSKEMVKGALAIRGAAALLVEVKLHEAVFRYPGALRDGLDIAAVRAGWGEAGKAAMLEQLERIRPAPFPISGKDLVAAGFVPGPQLGEALARLEREWIESGFALDKEGLLRRVGG